MADKDQNDNKGKNDGQKGANSGGPSKATREQVNAGSATTSPMERGAGQVSRPDKPVTGSSSQQDKNKPVTHEEDEAGGISNRPTDEEGENQRRLPPRGQSKP